MCEIAAGLVLVGAIKDMVLPILHKKDYQDGLVTHILTHGSATAHEGNSSPVACIGRYISR